MRHYWTARMEVPSSFHSRQIVGIEGSRGSGIVHTHLGLWSFDMWTAMFARLRPRWLARLQSIGLRHLAQNLPRTSSIIERMAVSQVDWATDCDVVRASRGLLLKVDIGKFETAHQQEPRSICPCRLFLQKRQNKRLSAICI